MYMFGLLDVITSYYGTQFTSTTPTKFCRKLGFLMKLVFIFHPQANGQTDPGNKLVLKVTKKKLDDTKELWVELLHEILRCHHSMPHLTTKETLFTMVYGVNIILLVDIETCAWRHSRFN